MHETWHSEQTDKLCEAVTQLKTPEEVYAFLEDIATIGEIKAMAQRLEVAQLLIDGMKYPEIVASTGASTATISRVKKCLEYGTGGYAYVLKQTEHDKISSSIHKSGGGNS